MSKHAPEPLYLEGRAIFDNNDEEIGFVNYMSNPITASRIINCYNACVGMIDPVAEIAQLRARVAKLTELCNKMGVKVEDDK